MFFPAHQSPSENGSTLNGKNLLPTGEQILSFLSNLFSEGSQTIKAESFPLKEHQFPLNVFFVVTKLHSRRPDVISRPCSQALEVWPIKRTENVQI